VALAWTDEQGPLVSTQRNKIKASDRIRTHDLMQPDKERTNWATDWMMMFRGPPYFYWGITRLQAEQTLTERKQRPSVAAGRRGARAWSLKGVRERERGDLRLFRSLQGRGVHARGRGERRGQFKPSSPRTHARNGIEHGLVEEAEKGRGLASWNTDARRRRGRQSLASGMRATFLQRCCPGGGRWSSDGRRTAGMARNKTLASLQTYPALDPSGK
jgi:hypothetical protein